MTLAKWRRVYRCDCDGVSHLEGHESYEAGAPEMGVRRFLDVIGRVTACRPPTCPWRAFDDPLVREVMRLVPFFESGNLIAALDPDPPGILLEAFGAYRSALESTRAEDRKLAAQAAEARKKHK